MAAKGPSEGRGVGESTPMCDRGDGQLPARWKSKHALRKIQALSSNVVRGCSPILAEERIQVPQRDVVSVCKVSGELAPAELGPAVQSARLCQSWYGGRSTFGMVGRRAGS